MAHPEQTGPIAGSSMGPVSGQDDEPPLDPAVERVRRKLVRLLLWSFGIMILGLIAVFSTIVYRINATGPGEQAATTIGSQTGALSGELLEAEIELPAGAQIVSTSLDGRHMLVHLTIAGPASGQRVSQLIVVDIADGRIIRRFNLPERNKN